MCGACLGGAGSCDGVEDKRIDTFPRALDAERAAHVCRRHDGVCGVRPRHGIDGADREDTEKHVMRIVLCLKETNLTQICFKSWAAGPYRTAAFRKKKHLLYNMPKKRKGVQSRDVLLRAKEIIRIFAVVKFTAVKE